MRICRIFVAILFVTTVFAGSFARAEVNIVTPELYRQIMGRLGVRNSDVKKYKHIFKISQLNNRILLGNILAEKYLHPKYDTSLEELKSWLDLYYDHPQAERIYKLAIRKGGASGLRMPDASEDDDKDFKRISLKYLERLSPSDRKFLVKQAKIFQMKMRQGKTLAARYVLENKRFQKLAPKVYWDNLAAKLAMKYLVDNYDKKALEWGCKASKRHNSGTATWVAGLASWRLKNYKAAASYFARLANSKNSDEWLLSAGGYWSARAYEKLGNHLKSQEMLKLAAKCKYTFYGILAAYQLGEKFDFDFDKDAYINDFATQDYIDEIVQSEAIVRALVLLKVKQLKLAEQELYSAYDGLSDNQKEAVILIANQHDMHSMVISLNRNKKFKNLMGRYEKELYPLPKWSTYKEWKVDKALVLALIRQESAFKDNATSKVGARGLMQLMPNTAYHISGDKSIKRNKDKLLDMDYNLDLGQKYVSYLLNKPFIEGNLFFMLTAYNGGPSNLVKWQKQSRYGKDPLLFIEVIPSAETRIYIERVMANYWIYNMRFNRSNLTLEQLNKGEWPTM